MIASCVVLLLLSWTCAAGFTTDVRSVWGVESVGNHVIDAHLISRVPATPVADACLLPNLSRRAFWHARTRRGLGDGIVETAVLHGAPGIGLECSHVVKDLAVCAVSDGDDRASRLSTCGAV